MNSKTEKAKIFGTKKTENQSDLKSRENRKTND